MACELVVTLTELEGMKLAIEDLVTFTYSPLLVFTDNEGTVRETLNGLIAAAQL